MSRQPKAVQKSPSEEFGLDVSRMDPFLDPSGEYGFAYIRGNGRLEVKTISQWTEAYNNNLGKFLEERISQFIAAGFLIPGYPQDWDSDEHDDKLMMDLVRVCSEYVDLQSVDWDFAVASWILYTWIPELFPVLPRMLINGPTNTGKSRVTDLVRLLGNKGLVSNDMSPAVMYRIAERFQPTLIYDEAQDMVIDKEKMASILNIFKGGYDRRPIYRMNENNSDFDIFHLESPMIMAVKNWEPPEDCINRSLNVNMIKKRRPISKERPEENEEFQELRGRGLAFRLKCFSGRIPIDEIKLKAAGLVDEEVKLDGLRYQLEDRAAELARVLIIPSLVFGGSEEVFKVLLESEIKARQALLSTREAYVFFALQADLDRRIRDGEWKWVDEVSNSDYFPANNRSLVPAEHVGKFCTYSIDVLEHYISDLRLRGDFDDKKPPQTRIITSALKTLGFKGANGTGNKFGLLTKDFPEVYLANLRSFGERPRDS